MNRLMVTTFFSVFLGTSLLLQQAAAHGTHIWFVSPEQNAAVEKSVVFEVKAPYAKNRYIHISVTREGKEKPAWEGLVPLGDKKYTIEVDVSDWEKGKYKADVTLLGGLVQHPLWRDFVVR